MTPSRLTAILVIVLIPAMLCAADAPRSATPVYIKLEVEDMAGVSSYRQKDATWSPRMAWYPQWSRGGDSGWWAAQGDAKAQTGDAWLDIDAPQDDTYTIWVRYEDYLGQPEPFDVVLKQATREERLPFGRGDVVLSNAAPIPWSYAWDKRTVALQKGSARVTVALAGASNVRRGIDCVVLTTDANWNPADRGFPPMAYAKYLDEWGKKRDPLPPLVKPRFDAPAAWKLPVRNGRDFWYTGASELVPGLPMPILTQNPPEFAKLTELYGAKPSEMPVFGSPACCIKVPIGKVRELLKPDNAIRQYILAKKVPFVLVGNYSSAGKIPNSYTDFQRDFGDLFVGMISGEGSYGNMTIRPENVPLDVHFKEANYQYFFSPEGRALWTKNLSDDWASKIDNPFEKFILALSCGIKANAHRMAEAGAGVIGGESAGAMPYIQSQMAFTRGAARQYNVASIWYYGASFGDAIRTFTTEGKYVLKLEGLEIDNRNAVIGSSLPHIRRTLLHAYLQGMTYFHPEQGYNFFNPDGTLNPMGWSYDEMMRLATRHPDRGVICTPVGVLMDRAHGWEKYDYVGQRIWESQPLARPDRMIDAFMNVAYYPFPRNEGDPATDLNICWPNGYFGDVFDVLVTSPTKTEAINAYPVIFCVGDTRLDARWGVALREYVNGGGTLVINVEQVTPASGIDEAMLGAKLGTTWKDDSTVVCEPDGEKLAGTAFRYLQVTQTTAKAIAKTPSGDAVALVNKVGAGQVILTTPSYLMGTDAVAMPYMARLLLQVTSGLLPVDVRGNCQHYVNLHPKGYVVVLSNNEGIAKLSHSAAKLDANQVSDVTLRIKEKPLKTQEWLGEEPRDWAYPEEWLREYTQPIKIDWRQVGDEYVSHVKLRAGEMRVVFVQTK